jgi:hypothetical protein
MNKLSLITAIVARLLSLAIGTARSAEVASANDTARVLGGVPPSIESPLSAFPHAISALPPKADIRQRERHVRFGRSAVPNIRL